MWAECPEYIFISQPCLVKLVAEMMLAELWGRWIGVSRDLYWGSLAAYLMPSLPQFKSRVQRATTCGTGNTSFLPVSRRSHFSLYSGNARHSRSLTITTSASTNLWETPYLPSRQRKQRPLCQRSWPHPLQKRSKCLPTLCNEPTAKESKQLTFQPVCPDVGFKHFQDLIPDRSLEWHPQRFPA